MSTHKHIDRICAAALILSLALSCLMVSGKALGLWTASRAMGYESRLFDASRVHTVEIVMDDWDSFLETCEDEEYVPCSVVIDNEGFKNVALRAKGNTSLSSVSALGSSRYSFKLEFDHYDSGKTYYGLDKLCLNNLIQDNTYMKDYLTYRLMASFGVAAPLCSYVHITVNGEDWGLYLAVEGLEDGFLQRNYGTRHGQLYKPDSMSFGGGRGNGRAFNMEDFDFGNRESPVQPELTELPDGQAFQGGLRGGPGENGMGRGREADREGRGQDGGFGGGMGSDDVKLKYIDDDPDSYANIFDSAKTNVSQTDQARLIQALKILSEGGDVSGAVDIDAVLRYFVVHNFVVNGDSYTGSMIHNYYLYEEDGLLSMLPWDYNLAFGGFQGNNASSAVNDPIDTPLSVTGSGDRPMADWIFSSEEYTRLYHQYFSEFLETVDCAAIIDQAQALIAPYVEQDPTRFCTYEEFTSGAEALKLFCALRRESVSGQLAGTIPSTSQGRTGSAALVDASGLTLSDMGSMNQGGFGGGANDGGFDRTPGEGAFERPDGGNAEPDGAVPAFGPMRGGSENMEPSGGKFGGRPSSEMSGGFPGGGVPGNGGAPGGALDSGVWILLGASVFILLLGLLAALRFKRFGR
ncbi:MAG: spore coat protein CotH [Oscillibacter sp.]|nr:spore coat protein CotH [Oscillibacter sp.]